MPFTKEKIVAYLKEPWTCPFCGAEGTSLNVEVPQEWTDDMALEGADPMARFHCSACGKTWRNYYKLYDIEEEDAESRAIENPPHLYCDDCAQENSWPHPLNHRVWGVCPSCKVGERFLNQNL